MAHVHSVYDSDRHFSIDPITRAINNEFSTKNVVIQNDHNSERFTFELPRYIEGHDMSICNRVEVHYLNIDAATKAESRGVYEVNDLQISPDNSDTVICSWLISNIATKNEGILNFLIRFACFTDDTLDYAWNTAIYTNISVAKGIYNSEQIIEEFSDVLAQWHRDLFETGGNAVVNIKDAETAAIEAIETATTAKTQEVLASIPDDYETLDANVTDYKKKVDGLANAIKGKVSGAVVRADDVSPVEHTMGVKVKSKNMLSLLNDSDIESTYRSWLVNPDGKTLTFSITDNDTSVDISGLYLGFSVNGENGIDGVAWLVDNGIITKTIRTHDNFRYVSIYGASLDNAVDKLTKRFNIQLEENTTPTEYTPYVDPASVTVTRCGKNLVDLSGFEFNDSNYTHILTGEDSPNALYEFLKAHTGESIVVSMKTTGEISGIKIGTIRYYNESNEVLCAIVPNVAHTILELPDTYTQVYIYGSSTGASVKDIQIEFGTVATDYEPFNTATYTPTTDGTILDMTSLSPTMTLLTDTEGAIVECEYNRDSNAVIADLYSKIADLSATT